MLQHSERRLGRFSLAVVYRGAVAVAHVDAQRVAGGMLIPFGIADDDGVVYLLYFMALELNVQGPVRFGGAGEDHHPAGDLVQPMDDPQAAELLLKLFDQVRSIRLPTIRQDGNPGGFVDDD